MVIWLVVVLSGSVLLSSASMFEVEVYRATEQFDLRIRQVILVKNGSSGDFLLLQLNATCTNPSSLVSLRLVSINTIVFVNGTQLQYAQGIAYPAPSTVQPAASLSFVWSYHVDAAVDEATLQAVEAIGGWNWYFWMTVAVAAPLRGIVLSMRSQPIEGVSLNMVG